MRKTITKEQVLVAAMGATTITPEQSIAGMNAMKKMVHTLARHGRPRPEAPPVDVPA